MNRQLEEIFADIERLEPFPHVAVSLLELSLQPMISVNEIVDLVETDMGLTVKIIRLANSSLYGSHTEIRSVQEASVRLGIRTVASLAMTSGARSFFMGMGSSTPRSNYGLWEESMTNALASQFLARREGYKEPELAYTVGLLQNMGHVVMDRFLERSREDILAYVDDGMSMLQAEKRVLGMHHGEIGARVVSKWEVPEAIVDGIRFHHEPERARLESKLCAITNMGEAVTWSMLGDERERAMCYGVSGGTLGLLESPKVDSLDEITAAILEQKEQLADLFVA